MLVKGFCPDFVTKNVGNCLDFIKNLAEIALTLCKKGLYGFSRSLHSLINESGIDYALRLYSGPKSIEKNETPKGCKPYTLVNLPLYYAGRLIRKMD